MSLVSPNFMKLGYEINTLFSGILYNDSKFKKRAVFITILFTRKAIFVWKQRLKETLLSHFIVL